ncbi:PRTRC system protein B [Pelobacter propionicus]|nr:PRTRC system protein B [Pelobacter propionicus]
MVRTHFEDTAKMTLNKAILLYEGDGHSFATIHNVVIEGKTKQSLGAGHPVDVEMLGTLINALGRNVSIGGYLPPNILSVGFDSMVWWVKPSKRRVFFKTNEEIIGERSEVVPHPGLVFGVNGSGVWAVCAVKGNTRPTEDTPIWQAPYFNVWSSGNICTGTIETPKSVAVTETGKWEECFFSSYFSHPNAHGSRQLINSRINPYQFWKTVLDGKYKTFPTQKLVQTNKTLKDFIKTINGSDR